MFIARFSDLPPVKELAIIINVETRLFSTLALLSTLRHCRIPTLLIECHSKDGSVDWFRKLMEHYDFHLTLAPLSPHGELLDRIVREIPAERLLLVDSDVELMADEMIVSLRAMLNADPKLYGSGFLHQASWFVNHYATELPLADGIGYFMERPWIPFTLLRTEPVRHALSLGGSFKHRIQSNEFSRLPLLSRLLWKRFQIRFFREHRLPFLDPFRELRDGVKPAYLFYDTGADIHECLTRKLQLGFGTVDASTVPWSVRHFAGVTRSVLDGRTVVDTQDVASARLAEVYGLTTS